MFGFFHVARAGNLRFAAGNCFLYNRACQHFAVKQNGNRAADIACSQIGKFSAAFIGELQPYNGLAAAARHLGTRITQILAG